MLTSAPSRVEPRPAPPHTPTAPQVASWAGPGNKVREAQLLLASHQPGALEPPPWVREHGQLGRGLREQGHFCRGTPPPEIAEQVPPGGR